MTFIRKEKIVKNKIVTFVESCNFPTSIDNFKIFAFKEKGTDVGHLAITLGKFRKKIPVLTRIHSQCLTGESLLSLRCDCGFQLSEAMKRISKKGSGVIFYLQQEGRGIGLLNKIKAYKLQDKGLDTIEANQKLGFADDLRSYEVVAAMADYLNISLIDLITNNPKKIEALEKIGLKINKRIAIKFKITKYNKKYLNTKIKKLGHFE